MSLRLPRMATGLFDLGFAVDAAAAGGWKIFGQLCRVGQDQVPDIVPRRQPGHPSHGEILLGRGQQCVQGIGVQFCEVFADDPRDQHLAVGIQERAGSVPSSERPSAAGFTRASTTRRSVPDRLRGSLTGQVVWRRQTSAR